MDMDMECVCDVVFIWRIIRAIVEKQLWRNQRGEIGRQHI